MSQSSLCLVLPCLTFVLSSFARLHNTNVLSCLVLSCLGVVLSCLRFCLVFLFSRPSFLAHKAMHEVNGESKPSSTVDYRSSSCLCFVFVLSFALFRFGLFRFVLRCVFLSLSLSLFPCVVLCCVALSCVLMVILVLSMAVGYSLCMFQRRPRSNTRCCSRLPGKT